MADKKATKAAAAKSEKSVEGTALKLHAKFYPLFKDLFLE